MGEFCAFEPDYWWNSDSDISFVLQWLQLSFCQGRQKMVSISRIFPSRALLNSWILEVQLLNIRITVM
jgi:hypothetical protein